MSDLENKGHVGAILDGDNNLVMNFAFNDFETDRKDLINGKLTISIVTEARVNDVVNRRVSKAKSSHLSSEHYFYKESRPAGTDADRIGSGVSNGRFDFTMTAPGIVKPMHLMVVMPGKGPLAEDFAIAYNDYDFGNFLWANSGKKLGISRMKIFVGAQLNNMINGRSDDPNDNWADSVFDSEADQRAQENGYYYPVSSKKRSQKLLENRTSDLTKMGM